MAMKNKNGGMLQPTPYNEAPGEADTPNISGGGLYGSWDEVLKDHLSMDSADLTTSPNMDSGAGIDGGPASGEPNPYGFSPTAGSKGGK